MDLDRLADVVGVSQRQSINAQAGNGGMASAGLDSNY
jgi:hypothetical protein